MRYFIKFFICVLFLLGLSANAKSINFAVVSDLNYVPCDSQQKSSPSYKALNGFIDRTMENNYDFVVFLGDNISKSKEHYLVDFLDKISKIKAPYYLVMGDKDVHRISGLSKTTYLGIVSDKNKYQKQQNASYVFYPSKEIAVIVLDGVSSGMPSTHGVFTKKTLSWLDNTLEKNINKKVIIFQHVPYLEPYEKPTYNMLDKQEYAAVINRYKNILLIMSGHYSQEYAIKDENGIYHISAPSLSKEPYYYHEVSVLYEKKMFQKASNFKIDGNIKPAI